MIIKQSKIIILLICISLLVSCGEERRIDGEMPFDSDSLMTMAESFLKAGDYGNAMRLYQRAANENPKHLGSRIGLAKTYQAMGAADAAINLYEQVLRLDPNNTDAKLGSGQMLITANRPSEAIPLLKELAKSDPKNYKIYNMIGLSYDLMGQQEEAQMNYGMGLQHAKNNISLLNNLALSFAFEAQYAPSIKLLSKAINLDYSVTKAQQNLIFVYVLSGEEDAARDIARSIMTKEEVETNFRHYRWIKSLNAAQRAQAIFLGIKDFPKTSVVKSTTSKKIPPSEPVENFSDDPKKMLLMGMLKEENLAAKKGRDEVIPPTQPQKVMPEEENVKVDAIENTVKVIEPVVTKKIYRVQLGSYLNTKFAEKGWQKLSRRSKDVLTPYEPLIKLVTLANGKTLFRLFVRGIENEAIARSLCEELRDRNIDCLVLKTSRN